MRQTKFPKSFIFGISTSSHQIEGNSDNDWSTWEKENATRLAKESNKTFSKRSPIWNQIKDEAGNMKSYISGVANNSYKLWKEDIELVKQLGVHAYRFSIEWSRIEPEQGKPDEKALEHYKGLILELKKNNIEPFVTILHRAVPVWFSEQGGWASKASVKHFTHYSELLAKTFGENVSYWMPLNEPVLNVAAGYLAGLIPPTRKNIFAAVAAYKNMTKAHNKAYEILKARNPKTQVGSAHAAVFAEAEGNLWYNRIIVRLIHYFANWKFLNGIKNNVDFLGIQYYTRGVIGFRKSRLLIPLPQEVKQAGPASDMGQEIYPEGLFKHAKLLWKKYGKSIIITENGIADYSDKLRPEYIKSHLEQVLKLLESGVEIRGYFHWPLLDNFEWDKGFWPRFGLVSVDKQNFTRTKKNSFNIYAKIVNSRSI